MLEYWRCPVCKEAYPPPTPRCPNDGATLELTQTLIGQVLDNKFRIESLLGVGGMGAVYRAMHLHLECYFAVKVLHPRMVADEAAIERFRREAKAARRIHHPNAIEVTDFGVTDEKLVYLVMEIVEGHLLRDLIREGAFDYHRATEILCQVCSAIQEAHEKQILHRDLKPENIIVRKEGHQERVKVLDFGLAKLLEPDQPGERLHVLSKAGYLMGTPQYMSPEQCKGQDLKQQSDIYALGVVAYEMLSGQSPFHSPTQIGYLDRHINATPAPLSSIAPNVPLCIERVIMTALKKAPDDRQHSADELAKQLRNAVREADEQIHQPTIAFQLPSNKITMSVTAETEAPSRREVQRSLPIADSRPVAVSAAPIPEVAQPVAQPARAVLPIVASDAAVPVHLNSKPASKLNAPMISIAAIIALMLGAGGYAYWSSGGKGEVRKEGEQPVQMTITDKFGDEMARIPGGNFRMGRNGSKLTEEGPEHIVTVNSFYLDKNEVTNEQYERFVIATGYRKPLHWKDGLFEPEDAARPVTHVTWTDADNYCRWKGKRLPLEKEWEYAASGGDERRIYPWGNEWSPDLANVGSKETKPAPIDMFKKDASRFGVLGLAGNVSEWVADYLTSYDPSKSSSSQRFRVIRGGNFKISQEIAPEVSRATYRQWDYPEQRADPDSLKSYSGETLQVVGLRCAKDFAQ